MRWAVLAMAVLIAACGNGGGSTSTTPPPATPEEVAVFCDRYAEVRDQDWQSMMSGLIDVAPAEIRGSVVRIANGPSDGYWQDRRVVEEFMERCDP